jgi:hypothetical protein
VSRFLVFPPEHCCPSRHKTTLLPGPIFACSAGEGV